MGIASRTLLVIAGLAVLAVPDAALAQFGNRLRQMVNPQQNAGGVQYAVYEGELHFEHQSDPVCTALSIGHHKVKFASRSGPGGIEAFMYGPQIMHAYIKGSDRNHLSVMYLGDSAPSATLRLTPNGSGFLGLVQSKTLVSELYGACHLSNAEFTVSRMNEDGQAAFQDFAQNFKLDVSSEQDLLLARRGSINEALPRLRQAFAQKTREYSANHPQMLRYYFYLALAYDEAGLYPSAAYWYRKSVAVCQQSFPVNDACLPITLLRLGQSLQANGDTRDAEPNIRQAIQASDHVFGPNAPVSWRGYAGLALVLINTGRFAEAERVLPQALALAKRDANPDVNVATVKYVSALLYRQTGKFPLAEDTLRESIALVQKVQGNAGSMSIFPRLALASIMSLSGQSAAAEPIARNAVEAERTLLGSERSNHPLLSAARVALATIDLELGKNREAEELLRTSLDADKKYLGPNHPSVAVDEMTLAKLLRTAGRQQEAVGLLQDAYRIGHTTENQGIRWRVPAEFMQLYASGKVANPALAVYYGKESVNALQRLRGNMSRSSGGTVEAFSNTAEVKDIYKTLAHVMLENGRIAEAQQVLALLSVQEMDQFSRRSVLADAQPAQDPGSTAAAPAARSAMTTTAADASTNQNPVERGLGRRSGALQPEQLSYSKEEQNLDQEDGEQIKVGEELAKLKQSKFDQGDDFSPQDEKRLEELSKRYEGYSNKFYDDVGKFAKKSGDPKHLKDEVASFSTSFQETLQAVGHGAVAVQYSLFDDQVWIVLQTATGAPISKSSQIKLAQMNQLIRDFRRKLADPHEDPTQPSQQLYKLLIGPIAADLQKANAKTLMLLLHDELRYVPFAALNDGKSYLVESMAIVNVNATSMDKLRTQPKTEPWSAYGLGVTKEGTTKSGRTYPALTYASLELDDVKTTLGGKSQIAKDEKFTKTALQTMGPYQVVHIASHFEFTPGSIDDSVLLLGDNTTMSLSEIERGLNFTNVELLTLSACQTALGDKGGGDGSEFDGLGNIAQEKGAKAVIATLWPVADASTAAFMEALYKAHQAGNDKAESLRQAQLTLLHASAQHAASSGEQQRGLGRSAAALAPSSGGSSRNPNAPFAHPYYWAPFILMGNWL